ncbi:putative dolichol-phosphate mannosyltransferase [Astathelohania contejeani]|uniref:Dolichol-phosphate mannosyltransferase subunit 1 n=1 Tax=Astathelohania contejeani TaxID=164912 RepID=A0ABQ7I0H9_9MICR|nr:putative dolichol-phosphate mannosyltransferase [Thelohania contejeani]
MYNIIIPTYNEKDNIIPLFKMIHEIFKDMNLEYQIILIDDNSPDNTFDIAMSLDNINIVGVKRRGKLGLGSAYKAAVEYITGNYVIIMDADLSHDPLHIKDMIKMNLDYDIICGTRYALGGGVYGWSLMRRLISRGANNVASIMLSLGLSDVTGSFRIYRADAFKQLVNHAKSRGYSYQMEVLFLAKKFGYRIGECPIIFYDRIEGVSKCNIWEMVWFGLMVLYLFLFSS